MRKKVAADTFTRVRLDRAFDSVDWCTCFPLAALEHLTVATSAHSSILLKLDATESNRRIEKKFRYEVM